MILTGVIYSVVAVFAGAGTGGFLALIGGALPAGALATGGILLAAAGSIVGVVEIAGGRVRPWQFDRETPQRWARQGPLHWAIRNGAVLGVGMSSRIGFWLWYVVPLGALASGDIVLGALLYGLYSLTRTGVALGLLALLLTSGGRLDLAPRLLQWAPGARLLAATQLVLISLGYAYAWWR